MIEKTKNPNCTCSYNLVFMDCNMPVMNGYDSCLKIQKLKKEGILKEVAIIACTADVT